MPFDVAFSLSAGERLAFVVALVVIKAFVAYISRRGFAPFAWYRIGAGLAAGAFLLLR